VTNGLAYNAAETEKNVYNIDSCGRREALPLLTMMSEKHFRFGGFPVRERRSTGRKRLTNGYDHVGQINSDPIVERKFAERK